MPGIWTSMLVDETYESPPQTDLVAAVRTHLPEVTVLGMDIKLAIKQEKKKDTMPNSLATLAFDRLNTEKHGITNAALSPTNNT